MRIGLACPYTWDVPGGVQVHVRDLAETLLRLGHEVSVITPVDDEETLPSYAVSAGKAMSVPYNGSVTRILMGPVSAARVRRWVREGEFDVVHAHEPTAPSVSLLACMMASGPLVATYHTSNPRSRILTALQGALQPSLEKVWANIAVSEAARRTIVEHLGVDAVLVPNGVNVAAFKDATPLPELESPDPTIVFVGRIDEPRKGLAVLLEALPLIARSIPDVRVLVAGPGDVEEVAETLTPLARKHVHLLGLISNADKPRVFRTADVYVAPNTGQESFGIVLLEAMAAHTPVVASDIDAFRRVLDDGQAGRLFANEDPASLAKVLIEVLGSETERARLAEAGWNAVQQYDWATVATEIVQVYETVMPDAPPVAEVRREA
ncbi:MAG: Phosphatidylinositol alpha-mannosyltransferase [Mycobacterium sp.]|nr:Phosphatidylinositol alpha-mannosyltransferase [Mycobacterium sp.]